MCDSPSNESKTAIISQQKLTQNLMEPPSNNKNAFT